MNHYNSSDNTRMIFDSYSTETRDDEAMECDDATRYKVWEGSRSGSTAAGALSSSTTPPLRWFGSSPNPGVPDALRVMTHAGRILWRAAWGVVGAQNPTLQAVSKLFRRSVQTAFGAHDDEDDANHTTNYTTPHQKITRQVLSAFSLGGSSTRASFIKNPSDESMDAIPYCSSDETEVEDVYSDPPSDVYSGLPSRKHYRESEEPERQPSLSHKRRKTSSSSLLGTLSSFLPAALVSDSEDDDGNLGDYQHHHNHKRQTDFEPNDRPAKRVRRGFATTPQQHYAMAQPCW